MSGDDLKANEGWPEGHDEIGALATVLQQVESGRRQSSEQARQGLVRLQMVLAVSPTGIAFTRERKFELVSPMLARTLGRTSAELEGAPAQTIFASTEDYGRLGPAVGESFAARSPYEGEWQLLRSSGQRFWARLRAQPVSWTDASAGTVWIIEDIEEEMSRRRTLEWAARHDALTGLANRAVLDSTLKSLLGDGAEPTPTALMLLDLDDFKPVNDRHGHAAGDAMLRAVAQAIQSCVRSGDVVARLGGDEFAVVLNDCPWDAVLEVR